MQVLVKEEEQRVRKRGYKKKLEKADRDQILEGHPNSFTLETRVGNRQFVSLAICLYAR